MTWYRSLDDVVEGTKTDIKVVLEGKFQDIGGNDMTEWKKKEGVTNIWIPKEEGEELVGTVEDQVEGNYGPQWVLKDDDGNEHRTPSHKVLQNRMSDVQIGDKVKIIYLGEELPKVKNQNPTRMYDVFVAEK